MLWLAKLWLSFVFLLALAFFSNFGSCHFFNGPLGFWLGELDMIATNGILACESWEEINGLFFWGSQVDHVKEIRELVK